MTSLTQNIVLPLILKYTSSKDLFLKERYAFLIVKNSFYTNVSKEVITNYNKYVKPLKYKSFISNWALEYKAGSEFRINQTAQSFYDYAQLAEREPTKRNHCFTVLKDFPKTSIKESLKFCRNNKERAAVYGFASAGRFVDALPYLEKVVELNPKFSYLEFLIAREINKNEYTAFGKPNQWNRGNRVPSLPMGKKLEKDVSPYFQKLRAFIEKTSNVLENPQTPFWKTSLAYTDWLVKDFESSRKHLEEAKKNKTGNVNLKNQILLQEMLLSAGTMEAITPEIENEWIGYLEKFVTAENYQSNFAFLKATQLMRLHYKSILKPQNNTFWRFLDNSESPSQIQNITEKIYLLTSAGSYENNFGILSQVNSERFFYFSSLANHSIYSIEDSTSLGTIQKVRDFVFSPKTNFDKRLIKLSGLTKPYISSILGKKLFQVNRYQEAANSFHFIPKSFWEIQNWDDEDIDYAFDSNPFAIKGINNPKDSVETPEKLCRKMAIFQRRTLKNPNDSEAWLGLALGTYSVSYFGKWWFFSKRYKSVNEIGENFNTFYDNNGDEKSTNEYSLWKQLDSKQNYYSLNKTIEYCKKCISNKKDRNTVAKATYLLAECYNHRDVSNSDKKSKKNRKDSDYFYNLLETKYSDTEFQKHVIQECATYNAYVNGVSTIVSPPEKKIVEAKQVDIQQKLPTQNPLTAEIILGFLALLFVGFMFKIYREK